MAPRAPILLHTNKLIVVFMDGIVLIDKPSQMSSFGVVARVRRRLSEIAGKKIKVGHTGTLDPFASGLMIIVVGSYCKRAAEFSKLDKTYEATLQLGAVSSTGDPEGDIESISDQQPARADVEAAVNYFVGPITQTPPRFSAIKINGIRAYKLARKGEAVEMPSRQITIHKNQLLSYEYPEVQIVCDVSSGTYVRTLAEDIGTRLQTGAYLSQLRRTSVGTFKVSDAVPLGDSAPVDLPQLMIQL